MIDRQTLRKAGTIMDYRITHRTRRAVGCCGVLTLTVIDEDGATVVHHVVCSLCDFVVASRVDLEIDATRAALTHVSSHSHDMENQ